MRRSQLKEMILSGESTTVEFKRKFTSPEQRVNIFCQYKGWLLINWGR